MNKALRCVTYLYTELHNFCEARIHAVPPNATSRIALRECGAANVAVVDEQGSDEFIAARFEKTADRIARRLVIEIAKHADLTRLSFNQRFWNAETRYLYDAVDCENGENDTACRPNQVFALSLTYPVLDQAHWQSVFQAIKDRLLTPVGLRTLSRDHSDYKADYHGDLHTRDAVYHQGTV